MIASEPNAEKEPDEEPKEELVSHEEDEPLGGSVPVKIMIGALLALIVTVGIIGYLISRPAPEPEPVPTVEPTGVPVLPVKAGDFSRDPGNATTAPDFGVDRSVHVTSAIYKQNGQPAYVVLGARPINESQQLLDQIRARAVRQVGDGLCGRDQNDLDVCVARRGTTAVLAEGLRDQTPEEILAAAKLILEGTE